MWLPIHRKDQGCPYHGPDLLRTGGPDNPSAGQRVNQLYGASAVSIDNYFIVFGGFSYPTILKTVNKYENGKWIKLKGMTHS